MSPHPARVCWLLIPTLSVVARVPVQGGAHGGLILRAPGPAFRWTYTLQGPQHDAPARAPHNFPGDALIVIRARWDFRARARFVVQHVWTTRTPCLRHAERRAARGTLVLVHRAGQSCTLVLAQRLR